MGSEMCIRDSWSAEMFPHAEAAYDWLALFDGIVVSGRVRKVKPDRDIFDHLLETFDLRAEDVLFIDDHEPNVVAARSYGMAAHHFQGAEGLRATLVAEGLLPETSAA